MNRLESETNTDLRQEKEKKPRPEKSINENDINAPGGNGREPEKYFKQIKR